MDIFQSVTKMVTDAGEAIASAASEPGQAVVETVVGEARGCWWCGISNKRSLCGGNGSG